MFDWILNKPLLFTMNREKGIALGEAVWRYPGLYNKNYINSHRIEIQKAVGIPLLWSWN